METRYQRVAREQHERQAARAKREKERLKLERRAGKRLRKHDPGIAIDQPPYRGRWINENESIEDRQDDLGESPDY